MSVFGPSSLGRPPNLDRQSYYGSGHINQNRSGHTGIRNLPEPGSRYSAQEVLGQKVQGLPNRRDYVPFQEKTQGQAGGVPVIIVEKNGKEEIVIGFQKEKLIQIIS